MHEQAGFMFPGDQNKGLRKELRATESPYEFYRALSTRKP